MKKVLLGILLVLVILVAGLVVYVQLRWDRTFDVPEPAFAASTDPAVVEHGRYLAYGPAHCAYCHSTPDKWDALDRGEPLPLAGGFRFEAPPGVIHTPNITPDAETGIGQRSDGQLARSIRDNVRHDGRAALPMHQYGQIANDDLVALVSFLRVGPTAREAVPEQDYNLIGKFAFALLIEPKQGGETPPERAPISERTAARGQYLSEAVAGCRACHTEIDQMDGSFIGPEYGGGVAMEVEGSPGTVLVSNNITTDPKSGWMHGMDEETFVDRFRGGGPSAEGSHMPWAGYERMSDVDLAALYVFLKELPPVDHDPGPIVQKAE
jgi:mono/diheme cytochrome c family protein